MTRSALDVLVRALVPFLLLLGAEWVFGPHLLSGWALVNCVLFLVFSGAVVAIHEGGHALAGRALGFRPLAVTVGLGPLVWERDLGQLRLTLRWLPVAGHTLVTGDRRGFRWRWWLFIAAGPATGVAALALLALGYTPQGLATRLLEAPIATQLEPLVDLVVALVLSLMGSLIPQRYRASMAANESDGLRLLRAPFLKDEEIDRLLAAGEAILAERAAAAGQVAQAVQICEQALMRFPNDFTLRHDLAVYWLRQGNAREAGPLLASLLGQAAERNPRRARLLNNLAIAALLVDQPALLPSALEHAREAYEIDPHEMRFLATFGATLAANGQREAGLAHLRAAIARTADPLQLAAHRHWVARFSNNAADAFDLGRDRAGI